MAIRVGGDGSLLSIIITFRVYIDKVKRYNYKYSLSLDSLELFPIPYIYFAANSICKLDEDKSV